MSEERQLIKSSKSHFTITPNIAWDVGLSSYELALYVTYIKIAGMNGSCYATLDYICKKAGMGKTKLRETRDALARPRKELGGRSFINIEKRNVRGTVSTDIITIVDLWDINFKNISTESPRESTVSPRDSVTVSPREPYINFQKEEPEKEDRFSENPLPENTHENTSSEDPPNPQGGVPLCPSGKKAKRPLSLLDGKIVGITDSMLLAWRDAYSDLDVHREILRAEEWIKAHPSRCRHRSDWLKFLVSWFSRAQESATSAKRFERKSNLYCDSDRFKDEMKMDPAEMAKLCVYDA